MNRKLTILLAALITVFGLFLPRLSSLVTDRIGRDKVNWQEVSPIELSSDGLQSLSLGEKLSLIRHGGQMVMVSDGIMRSTEDEIWQAFTKALTAFGDVGLLPRVGDAAEKTLTPFLIFDSMDGERCDLFWQVSTILPCGYDTLEITCLMDDESRNILIVYYTACTRDFLSISGGDLEKFSAAYFDRLGLEARILENFHGENLTCLLENPAPGQHEPPVHIDFFATPYSLEMNIY